MTQWVIVIGLVAVALLLAMVSVPLVLLLVAGGAIGWLLAALPSMQPRMRRAMSVAGLGVLVLGGGFLLFQQLRPAPGRTDGPFVTAYRQNVTLRDNVAEVEERYVIEADPGVELQRVAVEGEGTIQADDGSTVEGMAVVPANATSVAFTVSRPPVIVEQTPLGFRFWETTLPLLRATVTFQEPDEEEPDNWQVVRCRELDFLMTVESLGGRLVGANPAPERLEANEAEWRSLDDFDPTDFSPQVEVQVDQVPAPLQAIHSGVRSVGSKFTDSIVALFIGGVISSTTATVRKEWSRRKLPTLGTAQAKAEQ